MFWTCLLLRPQYLLPSTRVVFLLDSPTSRIKVVAEHIDSVQDVITNSKLEKFSIAVMCGGRLDYMSSVQAKLDHCFPNSQSFITLITGPEFMENLFAFPTARVTVDPEFMTQFKFNVQLVLYVFSQKLNLPSAKATLH